MRFFDFCPLEAMQLWTHLFMLLCEHLFYFSWTKTLRIRSPMLHLPFHHWDTIHFRAWLYHMAFSPAKQQGFHFSTLFCDIPFEFCHFPDEIRGHRTLSFHSLISHDIQGPCMATYRTSLMKCFNLVCFFFYVKWSLWMDFSPNWSHLYIGRQLKGYRPNIQAEKVLICPLWIEQ